MPLCFARRQTLATTCAALCATLLLLGSPSAQAKEAPVPVALDTEFKPAEQAAKMLEIKDTQTLKGIKRVAVTQFSVEFITADNVTAETSGFGAAGRAKSTGYYKLVGVAEPDFQALAEGFHGTFLKQLQAAGLDVVSPAEVMAAPTYRKLTEGATTLPQRGDTSVTVGPPGTFIYGVAKAQNKQASGGLFGALSAISGVTSAIASGGDNMTLQKELGGATLLQLNLQVHFVQLASNTRGFFGRMADSAKVSGNTMVSVNSGSLWSLNAGAMNNMTLKQPLVMDPTAFTELRVQAKSAGDVAGAVALGVLSLAIGSKNSQSSETFEAVADPAKYREVVGAGLATVGNLFVTRVVAER